MTHDLVRHQEVRHAVLATVARGDIPPGGPSELAARGLIDDAPADYWTQWADQAAARIRADHHHHHPEPEEGQP